MTPRGPRREGRSRSRGSAGRSRPAPVRGVSLVGQELELDVGPVAHGGHCVARHEGRVVFVRHTLPGERVLARVTEGGIEDRFLRADAVTVLQPAPERVEPVCRHAGPAQGEQGCGGCDWQHVSRAGQLALKTAVVREQLRRLAGIDWAGPVEAALGDGTGLGWRTRVEFAVDAAGRAGLRRHRSHQVVPVEHCPIADPRVLDTAVLHREWLGVTAVDVIAPAIGAPVVVPVPVDGEPAVVQERVDIGSWAGQFAVDARGFWQVHPGAAATLLRRVLSELAPRPGDRVLDLYAGAGLFAVPLADAVGPTGAVTAIEGDARAAGHARENGAGRGWLRVLTGRVAEHLVDGAAVDGTAAAGTVIDLVVLDPPRTGAGRVVMDAVCALRPRALVYVACDPAALARDLSYAASAGYRLSGLAAYDLFPMTHHVECVATLRPARAADRLLGQAGDEIDRRSDDNRPEKVGQQGVEEHDPA